MARELEDAGPKIVSTIHALETTYVTGGEFVGAYEGTKEVLAEIREWEAMARYADVVVVNSPMVKDEFKRIIEEHDRDAEKYNDKTVVISSGCDEHFLMSDDEVKEKLAGRPDVIDLVTFCRLDPSKGVEFSIGGAKEAAKLSSHRFRLTIAGIPSSKEYIRKVRKEAAGLPSNLEVRFMLLDAISPAEEKKEILDDKRIYILPTLKEPFGMSVIEASARGDMIVSADTNGPRFMFESGGSGRTDWGVITDYGVLADITDDHRGHFTANIGKAVNWTVDNWQRAAENVLRFNGKIRKTWTWQSIARQYLELFSE